MPNLRLDSQSDDRAFREFQRGFDRLETAMRQANRTSALTARATHKIAAGQNASALASGAASVAFSNLAEAAKALVRTGIQLVESSLKSVVNESSKFGRSLAEVSTLIKGDATPQMDKVRVAALRMAGQFGQMPTTVVGAFYDTISAGATSAAASMNVMNAAGALSVGGLADMKTSAKGIVSILQAFGETQNDFREAGRLADAFFVAMQKGITTIPDLVQNVGFAGGAAKSAGLSMEELLAAISTITTRGLNTEAAVVGINNVLKTFTKISKSGKEAAEKYGISLDKLNEGGFANFLQQIARLRATDKDAFSQIFPDVRGLRALNALLDDAGAKYGEIMEAMADKTGVADEAMKKVSETFEFQVRQTRALGTAFKITIGDMITRSPEFLGALKGLNQALDSMVGHFSKLESSTSKSSDEIAELTRVHIANLVLAFADVIEAGANMISSFRWIFKVIQVLSKGFSAMIFITKSFIKTTAGPLGVVVEQLLNLKGIYDQFAKDGKEPDDGFTAVKNKLLGIAEATRKAAADMREYDAAAAGLNAVGGAGGGGGSGNVPPVKPLAPPGGGGGSAAAKDLTTFADPAKINQMRADFDKSQEEAARKAQIAGKRELIRLEREHQKEIGRTAQAAQQFVGPVISGLGDMALEGKKMTDVIVDIGKQFARTALNWIQKQISMRIAQQATTTMFVANKAKEATAEKTSAITKITAKAGSAAAGAADSQASIPVVGPILAVAAAVAMLAFVLGLAGGFNQGGVVPGGGPNADSALIAATPGERVLSRRQTEAFDALVNGVADGNAPRAGNTVVFQLPSSGRIDFDEVAKLEDFIETKFAPTWERMTRDGRIGEKSLRIRRV